MAKCALLVATALLTSCFKDSGKTTTTSPPANTAPAVRGVDYTATLADPLGFLPIDSEIVIGIDVDQLRTSTFWPAVASKLAGAGGSGLTDFKQICGFDPMTTVHAITLGIKNVKQSTPDGVMVVRGLDRANLMACMDKAQKAGGGKTTIQDGIVEIHSTASATGGLGGAAADSTVAFSFVDASTVVGVIGPTASRTQLQAVLSAGTPLRNSPAFTELAKRTNLQAAGWAMLNGNSSVFDQATGALGSRPKAVFGSVNVTAGVTMDLRLRLETAAQAQQLQQAISGQIGMARSMFSKLDVTADDVDLVVALAMTDQQLSSMLQLAGVSLAAP